MIDPKEHAESNAIELLGIIEDEVDRRYPDVDESWKMRYIIVSCIQVAFLLFLRVGSRLFPVQYISESLAVFMDNWDDLRKESYPDEPVDKPPVDDRFTKIFLS